MFMVFNIVLNLFFKRSAFGCGMYETYKTRYAGALQTVVGAQSLNAAKAQSFKCYVQTGKRVG